MDKLKMHSPDMTQQNIEKIQAFFPNCVTESKGANGELKLAIDFDQLKQELSNSIVEGPQERYQLNWPGKREALLTANAPIAKTLRPCREESVNFDTTENLFIEGDNLDALKMLQETYLGKVKMIYIDPPYNTGNDFIYEDDFAEDSDEFLKRSNQKDEEGNRLIANTEANGRFHSDWLSMIYSRLKLARNFLSDDGFIFIQIDDNELVNLKKACDEIFGEENLINLITVKMSHLSGVKMSHVGKKLPKIKEFILAYSKNRNIAELEPIYEPVKWDEALSRYTQFITNIEQPFEKWRYEPVRSVAESQGVDFKNEADREAFLINNANCIFRTARNRALPTTGIKGIFSKVTTSTGLDKFVLNDEEVLFASEKMKPINGELKPANVLGDIWSDIGINNLHNEGGIDFRNGKKPIKLISRLIKFTAITNGIVLDFFAGSGTTAHAVTQLNAEDGGNRKFIMVQLPEECDKKSEAFKAGYKTIAEISKERIRRAGAKILAGECHKDWNKDVGFRVLKVDTSNMADVYYSPDQVSQGSLDLLVDNIKADRTDEDLLFQVLLDWGVDLTLPIRKETIQGKSVFFVDNDALVACFDLRINEALIKELATKEPLRVVFRDDGFESDAVKINAEQIFKQVSPHTEVKAI